MDVVNKNLRGRVLSAAVIQQIEKFFSEQNGLAKIGKIRSEGGGSINDAYCFECLEERFFVKVNSADIFPGMFACEARGLALLSQHSVLTIPKVILEGKAGKEQFLVLEYLDPSPEDANYFYELGKGLARLHATTQNAYGLDHANYIGSLPQDNTTEATWSEFFICRRIEPLLKQALDSGELPRSCRSSFDNFFNQLDELMPREGPSLLHGDLWSGNKMNTTSGPAIFDPAVYFGHREMDIAMSQLFGGFTKDFYKGYADERPLEKGWEQRVDLFNLYPLLVHTVLFGGSYASDVTHIIRRF